MRLLPEGGDKRLTRNRGCLKVRRLRCSVKAIVSLQIKDGPVLEFLWISGPQADTTQVGGRHVRHADKSRPCC